MVEKVKRKSDKVLSGGIILLLCIAITIPFATAETLTEGGQIGSGNTEEPTLLSNFFRLLRFTGNSVFDIGTGLDMNKAPWEITGRQTTFDYGERQYGLITLYNVYERTSVKIDFKNRRTGEVLFSYPHTISDPRNEGYAYWSWYCVYIWTEYYPPGDYEYIAYVDGQILHRKSFQINYVCTPGMTKCSGNTLLECNAEGTSWVTKEHCLHGCTVNRCNPAPTPTPTPYPTATPYPTPTPTPAYPPPIPGFESVFTILGVLIVGYLLNRKKE